MESPIFKIVLARANPKNESVEYWSSLGETEYSVQYVPGKVVYPSLEGSYLYAFTNLADAEAYMGDGATGLLEKATLQIWSGIADIVCTTPLQTWSRFDRFWVDGLYALDNPSPYVINSAPGSVWCHWIKLGQFVSGKIPKFPNKP